jgi:membrane-associated phospholipid phosphatase
VTIATAIAAPAPRPLLRGLAWLAFLAPFFFLTYGAANTLAAQRGHVGSIVFAWEYSIPFMAWTIVPYWSIDAFYGLSLLLCRTRRELDTHARRLLTAQIVAVACFVLFPLRLAFGRPETTGLAGFLFDSLTSFDQPFNQAPSLHIALLVILWVFYARIVPRWARWPVHVWAFLVGASVLTTYQHHFIDVPTGALLGFLCLYLWPDKATSPFALAAPTEDRQRLRLALYYTLGAAVLAAVGFAVGSAALWLLWPAVSLLLVATIYAVLGPAGFQKDPDGRMSLAAQALLAPYLVGAWINSRAWTRHDPAPVAIADSVSLGRFPSRNDGFAAVVDLAAELPSRVGNCCARPMLDLVTPTPAQLRDAAAAIEAARAAGPVLVCCALGFSRSAASVATWLLATRRAATVDDAIALVRRARPRIVLGATARAAIAAAAAL